MSPQSAIWLDGAPTTVLPLPDRGLDFGDGLFETLLVQRGRPLFTELHMDRLGRGVQALAIPDCLDAARLHLECAASFIAKEDWPWAVLRLSVVRGAGQRGYAPAENSRPLILIVATRLDRDCGQMSAAATLSLGRIRLSSQPLLAGIKHSNRLEQILAAAQAQEDGTDECIMLDQSDMLTSVIAGNLFLVRQNEILTPQLSDCGVTGTRRRLIIEKWGPALGLKVHEAKLTLQDLRGSDEVFYSNSLQAVRPVARMGSLAWENYAVCQAVFEKYLEELS
jgi:4-amino-4-deoxychorismate lyase